MKESLMIFKRRKVERKNLWQNKVKNLDREQDEHSTDDEGRSEVEAKVVQVRRYGTVWYDISTY